MLFAILVVCECVKTYRRSKKGETIIANHWVGVLGIAMLTLCFIVK
ncbi:hypothetical protein ACR56S_03940 [Staphylococcus hominis]